MNRRTFVAGGAATVWLPLTAIGQSRLPVVGFLNVGDSGGMAPELEALKLGLGERGFVDGQTVAFDYRWVSAYDQVKEQAQDLLRRKVDVIVAPGSANIVMAIQSITSEIPIVFANGADPVKLGVVTSLGRPGGNATGLSFMTSLLGPKRLELLRDMIPNLRRFGFIANPSNPNSNSDIIEMQAAAAKSGLEVVTERPTNAAELESAFLNLARNRVEAASVNVDAYFATQHKLFVSMAARHGIPTIYANRRYVASGGLISYTDKRSESFRLLGQYVGRILRGEKPSDLPVLQPTVFDLVINLKTAKALGIEVPAMLLARADEVIE